MLQYINYQANSFIHFDKAYFIKNWKRVDMIMLSSLVNMSCEIPIKCVQNWCNEKKFFWGGGHFLFWFKKFLNSYLLRGEDLFSFLPFLIGGYSPFHYINEKNVNIIKFIITIIMSYARVWKEKARSLLFKNVALWGTLKI